MTDHTVLFMETNRHHLQNIKNGAIKNLPHAGFVRVMVEFNPRYGGVDESDFNSVAKLVTETYQLYDQYSQKQVERLTEKKK